MSVFDEALSRRDFAKTTVAVTAGAALGVPAAKAALAQDATPVGSPAEGGPGLPPLPEGATVVAEGLWNPRFIAIGDDGTLYVTENGVGGDEVLTPPSPEAEGATPIAEAGATPEAPAEEAQQPPSTRGYTGQVSAIAPDGTATVLASGLASYSDGVGPVGITLVNGQIFFSIGGAAVGAGFPPLPEENTINRINAETGEVELVAELGPYEEANNPDGTDVNPNLYMIATSADGQVLVADAGGNTIYTVNPETGEFALTAVVPTPEDLTGAAPDPQMGPRQPVPTGIAVGGDGTPYVGLLSEMWPEGAPSILALQADGTFVGVAGPLSFNVGITVGPDGNIYSSELFSFTSPDAPPGPGNVYRISIADGVIEPVVQGVMMPHGLAFDAEGNLYIAINSLMSGPDAPAGQIIRIDGVAAAAS
ncbi:MAG TPA: ScyD/ScyE family protein [Thermomicrobiales bacterium]|nr:ScyD/ScyE family protein [Thermomicrobiales bacterium]